MFKDIKESLITARIDASELSNPDRTIERVSVLMHHLDLTLDRLIEFEQKTFLAIHGIDGLRPVDPEALREFKRMMNQEVIPEIIKVMNDRAKAAAAARQK